jgi:hypothetical protein
VHQALSDLHGHLAAVLDILSRPQKVKGPFFGIHAREDIRQGIDSGPSQACGAEEGKREGRARRARKRA